MTKKERQEVSELPYKYIPMSGWDYLGWSLVYALPIFGFFFVIINSLRSSNIARRCHARAYIVASLIALVVLAIAGAVIYFTGFYQTILDSYNANVKPIVDQYVAAYSEYFKQLFEKLKA